MPRSSAVRFSHFLPSLLLLLAGLAAAYVKDLNVFFTSLFNVLPTLVLLLGGAYCAVYRRQRELFLMVTVYIAYFLLDTQTDFYHDNGKVREDAAVVFHLVCLLLPLLFGLFAAWQERTHLFQDMVARFAVLLAFGSVALGLEQMRTFLPRGEQPEQQRQQQTDQVKHHGGVFAHLAIVAVIVGLGVEQKVGDVHREHQKQLALTSVNRTVSAAQEQHQGWQHVEQRSEENAEVFDVRSRQPREQQQQ